MTEIVLLDTEQITMKYYPETKIIHHVMHKYTHDEVFRKALMTGAEAMKKYKATKWLSDDRNNPVLSPADQEWTSKVWQAEVLKAGWKFWAIVQPQNIIAKLRMGKFAEEYSKLGVTVQLFSDPQQASDWLKSQ